MMETSYVLCRGIMSNRFSSAIRRAQRQRACPVYAYIDGGTASMLFQLLIAGIVAALFMAKSFWWRIRDLVMRLMGRPSTRDRQA